MFPLADTFFGLENNTHCIYVKYLLKWNIFGVHLFPDRVGGLETFKYFNLISGCFEIFFDGDNKTINGTGTLLHYRFQFCLDGLVSLRFPINQPDIFHLRFDAVETEAMCQRDKDIHRLAEDLLLFIFGHELYSTHIVQAVCQFDEYYTDIVIESKQDPFEIFGLHTLGIGNVIAVESSLYLGQTVNQRSYLLAEMVFDIFYSIVSILYHVMQQCSADGFTSQSDFLYHNLCYSNRVKNIGLSGTSPYTFVSLVGKIKGFEHQFKFFLIGAALQTILLQRFKFSIYDFVILFYKHILLKIRNRDLLCLLLPYSAFVRQDFFSRRPAS